MTAPPANLPAHRPLVAPLFPLQPGTDLTVVGDAIERSISAQQSILRFVRDLAAAFPAPCDVCGRPDRAHPHGAVIRAVAAVRRALR